MGKGSGRRPPAISDAELEARWAATFGGPPGKEALIDPTSPVGFVLAPVDTSAHPSDIRGT